MSILRAMAQTWARFRGLEWQFRLVLVFSLAATIYAQLAVPFYWGGGDPLDHLRFARYVLGQEGGMLIPWRPPGMGLFLIVVGVPLLDTFRGLVLAYAFMALALPLLVYGMIRRFSRGWAAAAGLAAVVSGWSVTYSRIGVPEQLFHFLHFLALMQISAWFAEPRRRALPYTIAITLVAANLVRPVAALYFWIFLGCAVLLVRRPLRHVAIATILYLSSMGAWALADRYWGASVFPTVYAPSSQDQRRFAEVYYSAEGFHFVAEQPPAPVLDRGSGPATGAIYEALEEYVRDHPEAWAIEGPERPYLLFGRYAGRPADLVSAVMSKPNFAYFGFLRAAIEAKFGTRGDRMMRKVASEHGNTGIVGILNFFRRQPSKLLVGGMPSFSGRNLLGIYYFTRYRRDLGRYYTAAWGTTSTDPELKRAYQENPTKDNLEALLTQVNDDGLRLLEEENGPATREFFAATELMIRAYPMYWENTNSFYSPYRGDHDGFARMVRDPRPSPLAGMYEGFYWDALIRYYGIGPGDRLFSQVALEALHRYPYSATIFLDNAIRIVFIRTIGDLKSSPWPPPSVFWPYPAAAPAAGPEATAKYDVRVNDTSGLSERLAGELQPMIEGTSYSNGLGELYSIGHLLNPLVVILAMMTFIPAVLSPARRIAFFLVLIYAYDVAVISVFGNFGSPRYSDVFSMLPVILACLGGFGTTEIVRRRAALFPPIEATSRDSVRST